MCIPQDVWVIQIALIQRVTVRNLFVSTSSPVTGTAKYKFHLENFGMFWHYIRNWLSFYASGVGPLLSTLYHRIDAVRIKDKRADTCF